MAYTAIIQNVRSVVNPKLMLAQVVNSGNLKLLAVLGNEVFDFSVVVLNYLMESLGDNRSRMNNTGDLCSQIMLFFTKEEWVSEDGSLEVSGEEDLDLTSCLDISGSKIWELSPFFENAISNPVGKLVNTSSLGFLISGAALAFTTFLATFDDAFSNIVVSLCARDLSKETNRACAGFLGKVLQASLDSPGFNLAKTDASPLVDLRVSSQIGDVTDGSNFLCLTFTCLFAFFSSGLLL